MHKSLLCLTIASIICCPAYAADSSRESAVYTCKYKIKKRDISGSARIEVRNGQIQYLRFENFIKGDRGTPGYSCELKGDRNDKAQKWQDVGRATTIEFANAATYSGNLVTISRDADGFSIDMSKAASNDSCGSGSELPDLVFVSIKRAQCKVE